MKTVLAWLLRSVGEINYYHYRQLLLIREFLGLGPIVTVDVGSHLGGWTFLASHVFRGSSHYMLDPLKMIPEFSIRKLMTIRSRFLNVAVSNCDGEADFYLTERRDSSTLQQVQGAKSMKVTTRRLDSLIVEGQILAPMVLKIDAEGHDLKVLESLGQFTSDLQALIIESPALSPGQGPTHEMQALDDWILRHGFHIVGHWPAAIVEGRVVKYDIVCTRAR